MDIFVGNPLLSRALSASEDESSIKYNLINLTQPLMIYCYEVIWASCYSFVFNLYHFKEMLGFGAEVFKRVYNFHLQFL